MNRLRLLLAMEHGLIRAGIGTLIESLGGVKVIAETGSGREAVTLSKALQPTMVLIDTALADGIGLIGQILHGSPRSRVVVLAGREEVRREARSLDAGASGILSRDASPLDLERMIRSCRDGGSAAGRPRASGPLTARQLEVLKHLSEGDGVKRTARFLGISVKTVETHRSQLMERLGIYDLPGLVRYALRKKITKL